jgi:dienelactone hydrolase
VPFRYVADVLKANGYAVLVPERRGYGKSDGQTFGEEVGSDVADKMIHRFHEEASDVLAGFDQAKQLPSVDPRRVVIMGWSHGGVVSLLASSERHQFVGLIDQAGGALTWNRSPALRKELLAAARKVNIPALCMDSQNDATTEAVREVAGAIRSSGVPVKTIIYPPFTPNGNPHNIAPGHLIFSSQGISIWQDDVLSFIRSQHP